MVARGLVWAQSEVHMIPLAGSPLHSFVGAHTDPDWWVGFLRWLGLDVDVGGRGEPPRKRDGVLSPQAPDEVNAFGQAGRAFRAGEIEASELFDAIPLADTELEPSIGEVIDKRHVLSHAH